MNAKKVNLIIKSIYNYIYKSLIKFLNKLLLKRFIIIRFIDIDKTIEFDIKVLKYYNTLS